MMNPTFFKLLWFAFPLTKLVYVYVALKSGVAVNNAEFGQITVIFLALGTLTSAVSIFLSTKVYGNREIFDHPLIKTVYRRFVEQLTEEEAKRAIFFNLFTTLLGFGETAALLGMVQFMMSGNLYAFAILIAMDLVVWGFNYPKTDILEREY